MGCTGSKPHLLLSSTISSHHNHSTHHHHHQSPQKGFILFNEKTFDYLKDNESEIKQKLIKRCEQKILTTSLDPKQQLLLMQAANASSGGTIGTSSISRALFSNAKRSLLPSLNEDKVKPNETINTVSSVGATPTTPTNAANSSVTAASPTNTKFKEMAIDAAVDYVLKYAINDFDIDNFKSSNHLSLKQIRKDIMKKTNNRESLTKINQALGSSGSNSNKTAIQHDMAYYKLSLHTAIDEFGSFIQENFIVINEYQKKPESQKSDASKDEASKLNGVDEAGATAISDEESLKLKEALELARQNFYKGKMSMVCLTKAGGYVVKEITEPTLDSLNTSTTSGKILSSATVDSLASTSMNNPQMSTSPTTCSDLLIAAQTSTEALSTSKSFNQSFNSSNCSDNKSQQTLPKINIEDVDTRQVGGVADTTTSPQQTSMPKSESVISNMSVKSLKLENSSDSQLSNTELNKLLNNTIELIVTYSTKPATELRTVHTDLGELLEANLKHAGKLIRSTSLGHVDQQVVQNLDHVNKEFKNYLNILNESERLELKNITEELNGTSKDSIDKFVKRNSALLELSSQLDSAIVNAKSGKTSSGKKSKSKKTTAAPPPPSTTNECIDIRKEIAISILNVGEVLAKTIDYYTLSDGGSAVSQSSANNQQVVGTEGAADSKKHSEELKELLRLSQEQAELERQQQLAKSDKQASPKPIVDDKQNILNEIDQEHRSNESSVVTKQVSNSVSTTSSSPSFLSTPSPSASTAPSTPGSVSPITLPNADHDLKPVEVDTVQQHCLNGHNDEAVTQSENGMETAASAATDILVNEFVSSIIDQAASQEQDTANGNETNGIVYRSANKTASIKQNGSGSKRVSLDEELMYQLEQVDKKVKYMNETCSENESDGESDDEDRYYDHDLNYNRHRGSTQPKGNNHSANGGEYNEDLDDENFDYDESVELGATGTPARQTAGLKQARTPAKIKSDIRQNRAVDLHEEIKQISNVIQDLVQTINVRNSTSQSNVNTLGSSSSNSQTAQDVSEQVHSLSSGSQSSTDCIDNSKSIDSSSSAKNNKAKFNTTHSFSSIPIRQKTSSSSLIKPVKAMSIDADHHESTSPNSQLPARAKASPNRNSFDASPAITPERQQLNSKSAPNSAHSANRVFKSKLPVKK